MEKYTVEDLLLDLFTNSLITKEQLEIVKEEIRKTGKCPVRILVEKNFIQSFLIRTFLKQRISGLSITDISDRSWKVLELPPTGKIPDFSLVDVHLLYNKAVLPLYIDSGKLTVLLADPTSQEVLNLLVEVYGYPLDKILCSLLTFDEIFSKKISAYAYLQEETPEQETLEQKTSEQETLDIKKCLTLIVPEDEFYNYTYDCWFKMWKQGVIGLDFLKCLGFTGEDKPPQGISWFKEALPICATFLNIYFPLKGERIAGWWSPYYFLTNYRIMMRKCESEEYLLFPFYKIKKYEVVPHLWKYKIIITLIDGTTYEFDLTKSYDDYKYAPPEYLANCTKIKEWEKHIDRGSLFLLEMTKRELQEKLNPSITKTSKEKEQSTQQGKTQEQQEDQKVNTQLEDKQQEKKWKREIEL